MKPHTRQIQSDSRTAQPGAMQHWSWSGTREKRNTGQRLISLRDKHAQWKAWLHTVTNMPDVPSSRRSRHTGHDGSSGAAANGPAPHGGASASCAHAHMSHERQASTEHEMDGESAHERIIACEENLNCNLPSSAMSVAQQLPLARLHRMPPR